MFAQASPIMLMPFSLSLALVQGTTGMPKAATLSHFNLVNNSRLYGERVGFERLLTEQGRPARVCLPVPIFHAFGAMMGTTTLSTCPITIGNHLFLLPVPLQLLPFPLQTVKTDSGLTRRQFADDRKCPEMKAKVKLKSKSRVDRPSKERVN
jgi:acyl-CoA synthetase (AMP-forming)/AMP-acid ligase II